jgi:hypothetical protein
MSCVVDHLAAGLRVRVRQDFVDARDVRRRRGETGVIRALALDWARQEIVLEWESAGGRERMFFALAASDGPGNGRMRAYFDVIERSPPPPPSRRREAPAVPEPAAPPVTDPMRYEEAFARVWALAARSRFAEAEQQLQALLSGPDPHGGVLERAAGDMVDVARAHALDPNDAVYAWARKRATDLWYAWGAQATSGGEGMARLMSIRTAEERLAACDARRA